MDMENLKKLILSAVAAAKFGASLSKTDVDDRFVHELENLVNQPWFFELVHYIMGYFDNKAVTLEGLREAVAEFTKVSGAKYDG